MEYQNHDDAHQWSVHLLLEETNEVYGKHSYSSAQK